MVTCTKILYDALNESAADIALEGYNCAGLIQGEGVLGTGDWGGGIDKGLSEQSAGQATIGFSVWKSGPVRSFDPKGLGP